MKILTKKATVFKILFLSILLLGCEDEDKTEDYNQNTENTGACMYAAPAKCADNVTEAWCKNAETQYNFPSNWYEGQVCPDNF